MYQLLVLKTWLYIKNYDQYCFLCREINILLKDLNSYLKTKPNIKNKKHSVWFWDTYVAALHIPCLHWQCGSSVSHLMRIFAWHNAFNFLMQAREMITSLLYSYIFIACSSVSMTRPSQFKLQAVRRQTSSKWSPRTGRLLSTSVKTRVTF